MKFSKDYNDIIHLPYHGSKSHRRMTMSDRAAQFAPFAALTGHDAAIKETARIVEQKIELDESQKTLIDITLNEIQNDASNDLHINITYFQPDSKKMGGTYINTTGTVKRIDPYKETIALDNSLIIPFDDIYDIEIMKNGSD